MIVPMIMIRLWMFVSDRVELDSYYTYPPECRRFSSPRLSVEEDPDGTNEASDLIDRDASGLSVGVAGTRARVAFGSFCVIETDGVGSVKGCHQWEVALACERLAVLDHER